MICFDMGFVLISSKLLHFYQPANLNLRSKTAGMHIVVKANAQQKEAFLSKGIRDEVWTSFIDDTVLIPGADAYFDLCFEENGAAFSYITSQPVFVNAVIATGKELPSNYIRINAWAGFLTKDIIEIVVTDTPFHKEASAIIDSMGWKFQN